jgi:23S rRNA pseudouridine1911/1915/1917 synthase
MTTSDDTCTLTVDEGLAGSRLDHALGALMPELGLRGRKRMVEADRVLVDGRPAPASLKLRAGQRIDVLSGESPDAVVDALPVLVKKSGFAALAKPAGLHSASLAGGGGPSAESMLAAMFTGSDARLLNRLDFMTSGLLLVALTAKAAKVYAALDTLDVLKEYQAVVAGTLAEDLELKRRLDADDRRRTRVLGKLESDPRLWTLVTPSAALEGGRTLVRVRIHAGARHQIRAHLAAAGLPILGDPLYGEGEPGGLYLHHSRLEFPGFSAQCDPPWLAGLKTSVGTASALEES